MSAQTPRLYTQNLRVLYVEDEVETLQECSRFLKKRVGTLKVAANGIEALSICEKDTIDVVITDLRMPVMDGLELLKALRDASIHCPVIITSAFSDSDTILKAVDSGIVKYCVKPINTDELIHTLNEIARNILEHQGALTDSSGLILNKEEKQEYEKKLKSDLSRLIKTFTGKGPKDVQTFWQGNTIHIQLNDILTPLEHTLIEDSSQINLVTFVRKSFYLGKKAAFEACISTALNTTAQMTEVLPSPKENRDHLIFVLKIHL